jgi:hypothetical protein
VTAVLTHDSDVKIYEIEPGISSSLAPVVGLPAGPSFHFVLNDTIYEDNRIPPRGFTNAKFDSIQSPPVDYTYADGQYWDETDYLIPGASAQVIATLYYQTVSKEYVEFLRDENHTDSWGDTLYNLWAVNGKSAPVVMAADTVQLQPVIVNHPPVLDSIGPQTVAQEDILQLRISATDADGDSIILTALDVPSNGIFTDSGNGVGGFVFIPDTSQTGVYDVIFVASDSLLADSVVVYISVSSPTCTAIPGDPNASNSLTLGDAISIVNYIFNKPGYPPCASNSAICWLSDLLCRGDVNASETATLGDVIQLVNRIFNKPCAPLPPGCWEPLPSPDSPCCLPVP